MSRVITLVLPNRAGKKLPLSMADFERLFDYIGRKSSVKLTEDERNLIVSTLKSKRLRKRKFANTKRMHAAISFNAEERYEDLVRTYPHFLQRFPQNMIASYLGISPETLSRIRHAACKKEKAAHIKAAT